MSQIVVIIQTCLFWFTLQFEGAFKAYTLIPPCNHQQLCLHGSEKGSNESAIAWVAQCTLPSRIKNSCACLTFVFYQLFGAPMSPLCLLQSWQRNEAGAPALDCFSAQSLKLSVYMCSINAPNSLSTLPMAGRFRTNCPHYLLAQLWSNMNPQV